MTIKNITTLLARAIVLVPLLAWPASCLVSGEVHAQTRKVYELDKFDLFRNVVWATRWYLDPQALAEAVVPLYAYAPPDLCPIAVSAQKARPKYTIDPKQALRQYYGKIDTKKALLPYGSKVDPKAMKEKSRKVTRHDALKRKYAKVHPNDVLLRGQKDASTLGGLSRVSKQHGVIALVRAVTAAESMDWIAEFSETTIVKYCRNSVYKPNDFVSTERPVRHLNVKRRFFFEVSK